MTQWDKAGDKPMGTPKTEAPPEKKERKKPGPKPRRELSPREQAIRDEVNRRRREKRRAEAEVKPERRKPGPRKKHAGLYLFIKKDQVVVKATSLREFLSKVVDD